MQAFAAIYSDDVAGVVLIDSRPQTPSPGCRLRRRLLRLRKASGLAPSVARFGIMRLINATRPTHYPSANALRNGPSVPPRNRAGACRDEILALPSAMTGAVAHQPRRQAGRRPERREDALEGGSHSRPRSPTCPPTASNACSPTQPTHRWSSRVRSAPPLAPSPMSSSRSGSRNPPPDAMTDLQACSHRGPRCRFTRGVNDDDAGDRAGRVRTDPEAVLRFTGSNGPRSAMTRSWCPSPPPASTWAPGT